MSDVDLSLNAAERSRRLRELAALFLRLGATAFGGPAAHIAMMEDEVVTRRKWLTPEEFTDTLGIVNIIPGPNSTELAIHIGYARAGWGGLLVAGVCFIVPATLIVAAIGWAYVAYGTLPQVQGLLMGVKPVIIAVIAQAVWRLARSACKDAGLIAVGVLSVAASMLGVHELLVLAGAGVLGLVLNMVRRPPVQPGTAVKSIGVPGLGLGWGIGAASGAAGIAGTGAVIAAPFSPLALFLFFVKVGSVLFGSGYVLLAFLKADLVDRLHWLTEQQLLDAVAVGQVTPGPVFTTATFIGFLLGGWSGAAVATVGIFLVGMVANFLLTPLATLATLTGPFTQIGMDLGLSANVVAYSLIYGADQYLFPYEYAVLLYFYSSGYMRLQQIMLIMGLRAMLTLVFLVAVAVPYWQLLGIF